MTIPKTGRCRRALGRFVAVLPLALLAASLDAQDPSTDIRGYVFRLGLDGGSDRIEGVADVVFEWAPAEDAPRLPRALRLDLIGLDGEGGDVGMAVSSVSLVGGDGALRPLRWTHDDDVLEVAFPDDLGDGVPVRVRIEYAGVPADGLVIREEADGRRTFFGDNWPNRARHWLPLEDHPSDKARVRFEVEAPVHDQVISVGSLVAERDLGDGRRLTIWASDHDLPTKVMVVGVGRFAVEQHAPVRGIPVQSWILSPHHPAAARAFDETADVLTFFVDRFGSFPYEKLANVQSRTRFGGMENASAIFYAEAAVAAGAEETLVAHEIAHQWFGDAVSETDWPHLWLSEGFATYLTALWLEWRYGPERREQTLRSARDRVVALSRGRPAPVVPERVTDLMGLLNANSYQKGAWFLHMLRRRVGDDVFWDALRETYERYRDRNASTTDFRVVVEELLRDSERADRKTLVAGMEGFFEQWLRRPGQPVVAVAFEAEQGRSVDDEGREVAEWTVRLHGTQRPFAEGARPFRFPLEVELVGGAGETGRTVLDVDGWEVNGLVRTSFRPVALVLDPDAWLLFEPADAPSPR